jgi:uncharacterized protein YodC (DUF2158 family)
MSVKIGDVVRLRSGGPLMTVLTTNAEKELVVCSWFDQKDELKSGSFHQNQLIKEG